MPYTLVRNLRYILDIDLDRAFGLDVGERSLEIMELKRFFVDSVMTYGRVEVPPDVIQNGRILQQEMLAKKVVELLALAKPHKVSTNRIVFSLPESTTLTHYFSIPLTEPTFTTMRNIREEELEKIILKEVAGIIPSDPATLYYDWQVARAGSSRSPDAALHVLFVGIPKETVDPYLKLFNELGFETMILDIESENLGRALISPEPYPQMIADIGTQTSTVSFFDPAGFLNLSVNIPIGGAAFTEAIAAALRVDPDQAERIKRTVGIGTYLGTDLGTVLQQPLGALVGEFKKTMLYYEARFGKSVGGSILAGGSALMPGLLDYLTAHLPVGVRIGNPLQKIIWKRHSSDTDDHPLLFSNVIGLALRGVARRAPGINILKRVPRSKFEVSHRLDLLALGHLKKTTFLRSLANNPLFVFIALFLSLFGLGYQVYTRFYQPALRKIIWKEQPPVVPLIPPEGPSLASSTETSTTAIASTSTTSTISVTPLGTSTLPVVPLETPTPNTTSGTIHPPLFRTIGIAVLIGDTPTGWLMVRSGPGATFAPVAKVYPGTTYPILEEQSGWYKITVDEKTQGWVSGQYSTKMR